jgi:arginyl-tRNA synthetase
MPNVARILDERVTAAMRAAYPDVTDAPAIVVASQDTRFGDYQANGAMGLAKRLKVKPRDVAQAIVAKLDLKDKKLKLDICDPPEIAGPGFLNFRLSPAWLASQIGAVNADERIGVPSVAQTPSSVQGSHPGTGGLQETVVVDYSAPNLAKEMHVGHLRSTIIGDALARMLAFSGRTVVRQNHIGDWGTQFGMLMAWISQFNKKDILRNPLLSDIEARYRAAKQFFDSDPKFSEKARQYVVRLQAGDEDCLWFWDFLYKSSLEHGRKIYARLGVLLTDADIRGESFYNPWLKEIVDTLRAQGMITESQGAQCVFLKGPDGKPLFVNKEGEPLPLIVQKSDEGYLYSTTDLAAIRFRVNELKASRILYTVDARQALHFQQVFACARQAGFAKPETVLEHIAFGTMMGNDGKPFKTREGGTVKLMDLLDEAEKRAYELVSQKNAGDVEAGKAEPLTEDQKNDIAHKIGIGAVKYADLSQNRTSDYVFSWEKMLALDGNTAPYMQYAYARVRSIFRKGAHAAETLRGDSGPISLDDPKEQALAKKVLQFAETLDRALDDYRPNIVAAYLYDLAQAFTGFYDACPVLSSPEPLRTNRLKLCDLTARTIQRGLNLLGIETAERM